MNTAVKQTLFLIVLIGTLQASIVSYGMPSGLYHSLMEQSNKNPVLALRTLESQNSKFQFDLNHPEYLILRMKLALEMSKLDELRLLLGKTEFLTNLSKSQTLEIIKIKLLTHYYESDYTQALELAKAYLESAKQLGNQVGVIYGYSALVTQYSNLERFEEAENAAETALKLLEVSNSFTSESHVYNSLSDYYINSQNLPMAIEMIDKAIEAKRKLGHDIHVANLLFTKGEILFVLKDYEESKDAYVKALKISTDLQDPIGAAFTSFGLSKVYYHQNKLNLAKSHIESALEEFYGSQEKPIILVAKASLVEVLVGLGDYERANALMEEISNSEQSLIYASFEHYEQWRLIRAKDIAIGQNNFKHASELYEKLLAIGEEQLDLAKNKNNSLVASEVNLGLGIKAIDEQQLKIESLDEDLNELAGNNERLIFLLILSVCVIVFLVASLTVIRYRLKVSVKDPFNGRVASKESIFYEHDKLFQRFKYCAQGYQLALLEMQKDNVNSSRTMYKRIKDVLSNNLPEYWSVGRIEENLFLLLIPSHRNKSNDLELKVFEENLVRAVAPVASETNMEYRIGVSQPLDTDSQSSQVLDRAEQALFIASKQLQSNVQIRIAS